MRRRTGILLLFLLLVAACETPTRKPERPTPGRGAPREVVLVTTTDFHGALERAEGLAHVIGDLRRRYGDQMFFADGGDQFQGTMDGRFGKGDAVVAFFNLIGLDVAAVGNHELTYGVTAEDRVLPRSGEDPIGNFRVRLKQARYQWLSANWLTTVGGASGGRNALGETTVVSARAIMDRGGTRACFIGATTPQTPGRTIPDFVRGTSFERLAPVVAAEAARLRGEDGCTFVILVAHAGLSCRPQATPADCLERGPGAEILELLEQMPERTVDAVVAGHTHLAAQVIIRGTPVIEAGANGKLVGVLHLFQGGARAPAFEPFIDVPERAITPEVTRLLEPFRARVDALRARPTGEAIAALPRDVDHESALGNLVADALLSAGRSDGATVAVMHAGHIRDGLPAGPLRYEHVFRALPFDNNLVIVELSEAELRKMLETATSGVHGLASVSGLKLTLAPTLESVGAARYRLVDVRDALGRALEGGRMYRIATVDYLARGGDEQEALLRTVPASRITPREDRLTRDLVAEYLRRVSPVRPEALLARPRLQIMPAPTLETKK